MIQIMGIVYLALTAVIFFSLWVAGIPIFDALTLAFSTVSTGGFSVTNSSVAGLS